MILDIQRNLISKDVLEIYKVHKFNFLFNTHYFIEKIVVDRKQKIYESWINTFKYVENCKYSEIDGGVRYIQNYSVPFFLKSNKENEKLC